MRARRARDRCVRGPSEAPDMVRRLSAAGAPPSAAPTTSEVARGFSTVIEFKTGLNHKRTAQNENDEDHNVKGSHVCQESEI